MAVTITQIEEVLYDLWSGKTITTLDKGAVVCPVFVDRPDVETFPEKEFPSIAILFNDLIWDSELENTVDQEAISIDTTSIPYIRVMRRKSVWYRVNFTLHAFTLDAAADREITRWIDSRILPRDAITVDNQDFWVFRTGFSVVDIEDSDRIQYHKIWSFEVLADIDNSETDEEASVVHLLQFTSSIVNTAPVDRYSGLARVPQYQVGGSPPAVQKTVSVPVNSVGEPVTADQAVLTTHRTFQFDNLNYWILG